MLTLFWVLLIAAYFDLKYYRVPNWLIVVALILGITLCDMNMPYFICRILAVFSILVILDFGLPPGDIKIISIIFGYAGIDVGLWICLFGLTLALGFLATGRKKVPLASMLFLGSLPFYLM